MNRHNFLDFEIYNLAEPLDSDQQHILSSNPSLIAIYPRNEATEGGLKLLNGILKATKVNDNDIVHFAFDSEQDVYLSHSEGPENQLFLCFGLHPRQIGFNLDYQPYKPVKFEKKVLFFCDSLSSLQIDQDLKRKLWMFLKAFYEIN